MATLTSHPGSVHRRIRFPRYPLLTFWHLLSLDAPTVAALWTWFLATTNHIRLPATSIAAMATAVWLLYASDRLLDAQATNKEELEPRHHFHHRHRKAFLSAIAAATITLAGLLPTLTLEAVHLYLIEGSFLIGYFVLIHATNSAHRLPKELAVGLFFASATFIPTIAREPALRLSLLLPAILFAALCSLNCLFIYTWEHPSKPTTNHSTTRFCLQHLEAIATTLLVSALGVAIISRQAPWKIAAAIATAVTLLLILHRNRQTLPPTTLRAAADLALLTPLLFLL